MDKAKYPKLSQALGFFRELFELKRLNNSEVYTSANFLKRMRFSDNWSNEDAYRLYNLIKPYSDELKSLGYIYSSVPVPDISQKEEETDKTITIKDNYFIISFPFNKKDSDFVKSHFKAEYEKELKAWKVNLSYHKELRQFAFGNGFNVGDMALKRMDNVIDNYKNSYKAEGFELDKSITDQLKLMPYPYQHIGIDYGVNNQQCIFGDDMGIGKTVQAMTSVLALNAYPCLVIVPKHLIANWVDEIQKFTNKKALIISRYNINKLKIYIESGYCDYAIINYDGIKSMFIKEVQTYYDLKGKRHKRYIAKKDLSKLFKAAIVDESHYLKEFNTGRTKACKSVLDYIDVKYCLTGTPIVNKVLDLAAQLDLIGQLDKIGYGNFIKMSKDFNIDGENELNKLLRSTCFIRRQKHQVLKDLPDKIRQTIRVNIDNVNEYEKAYEDLERWMIEKNFDPYRIDSSLRAEALVKLNYLSQISSKGKLKQLKVFVNNILIKEKLIIFCWFTETIRDIEKLFPEIKVLTLYGKLSTDEIREKVNLFQNNNEYKLIIISFAKGAEGLTLTASSKVLIFEQPWNSAKHDQAEDRSHRIGVKDTVFVYDFIGNGTVDNYKLRIVETKRELQNKTTGGENVVKNDVVNDLLSYIYNGIGK